ncbi:MAG: hypothetical protein ACFB14_06085 [Leptolyngbyaceae cyanobacterium]
MTENNFTLVNLETPVCTDSSVKQITHNLLEEDLQKIRGGFSLLPIHPIMQDPCAFAVRELICAKEIKALLRGEEIEPSPCGCFGRDI